MRAAPCFLMLLVACGEGNNKDTGLPDDDGDGFTADLDCDDGDASVYPDAVEACDEKDNNCDGDIDEDVQVQVYVDADLDGYGVDDGAIMACAPPEGYAAVNGDCDDTNDAINPDAEEACNGYDDNCDGVADDGAMLYWYVDADGDGYGDPATEVADCFEVEGHISTGGDCADDDPLVNPGVEETCDLDDDNCDGRADLGVVSVWHTDEDGDGYGHPARYESTCDPDPSWVLDGTDCSPGDASIHPNAPEACDGWDQDCDGLIDEDFDLDGDGFQSTECASGDDCDDSSSAIFPGADEVCGDGVDDDCDGADTYCGFSGTYDLGSASVKHWSPSPSFDAGRLVDVGDVNGDGIEDTLVATLYAESTYGGGYLFYGPLSGHTDMGTAGFRLRGTNLTYGAGRSIGLADTNADGYEDIIFGAPYSNSNGGWVVMGPITQGEDIEDVGFLLEGRQGTYCAHGSDLGDVNGDGYADAAIGAYAAASSAGIAFIAYGPFTDDVDLETDADGQWQGDKAGILTGRIMRAGVDMNGDGMGDILAPAIYDSVAGSGSGSVFVISGPASGTGNLSDAQAKLIGEGTSDYAGQAIAMYDVNADGYGDAVVGSGNSTAARSAGAGYVVFGPVTGEFDLGTADIIARGTTGSQMLGAGVAARDVDGNGYGDLLLGATGDSSVAANAGGAYLFYGPMSGTYSTADAAAVFGGETSGSAAGQGVALGDVDGDGWGDMLIGAPSENTGGSGAGALYVQYPEY